MKPRSQYQRDIVALQAKLPPITEKQRQWAFEHCFETDAYHTKGTVWCLHCGEVFKEQTSELKVSVNGDQTICPKCGRKLKLQNSRKAKFHEKWYYTIITTSHGFQVCRHFIVIKTMYKVSKHIHDCQEPYYGIEEVVQNWIDKNGRETVFARPRKGLSGCNDRWDFCKPMELREKRCGEGWYTGNAYEIDAYYVYPRQSILPIIKRNGYTSLFKGFPHSELFKHLLTDNRSEMLIKNKQFSLLCHKLKRGQATKSTHEHTIRIANRNKYIVEDASMWNDYLDLLDYFHLDTHNAHYVCPRDLKTEHDKLMRRKQRIEAKLRLERQIADAKRWEDEYRESKSKFFGICFGNDNIIITVIPSVAEIAEEGKAMHHCVYTNGYYKREDSLILSARDREGNRIETIELSLKTFQVVQSRGVNNSNTEHHDEILQLMKDNVKLIMQAA